MVLQTGLISREKEKAFNQVKHQYLWQTLAAFGWNPEFVAKVRVLDSHVARVLKINGGLSAPFAIQSGVRQGYSFSRSLYCLAVAP